MNRRQKIIISVTGIFIVLLLVVGLTYAYFLTKISGNNNSKSISASTANLALVYGNDDGNVIGDGELIVPNTTFDAKTFTVTNKGNADTDYVVVIENATNNFKYNDFVYTLSCTSDGESCNGVSTETTYPINGGILVANSIEVGKTHTYSFTLKYVDTGSDQSDDMNKTLTGRINIADPNSFNPYAGDKTTLAYNIINNAVNVTNEQKTLGYAEYRDTPLTTPAVETTNKFNKTGEEATSESSVSISTTYQGYYWTYGTGYTVDENTGLFTLTGVSTCKYNDGICHETLVGKYIIDSYAYANSNSTDTQKTTTNLSNIYKVTTAPASSTSTITMKAKKINRTGYSLESTLSTTQDDYGISYYYRGDVENNYLSFNNMCWRIVRIEGDGSIKITLADKEAECSTATQSKTGSAFIGTGTYGYILNTINGIRYFADYDNSNNTNSMKYKFNIFLNGGSFESLDSNYNTETKTYTAWSEETKSKLKKTTACIGDVTTKYDSNGAITTSTSEYYYDSYVRLFGKGQTANATLICNAKGAKTSETQIFPLTADEVVFAGGKGGAYNYTYYLRDNATSDSWWTLSIYYSNSSTEVVFYVNNYYGDFYGLSVGNDSSLRPAVSLVSGTQISSGDGTISNPYTVE